MDKQTAMALERVATDAPQVAALLAKALDDGLISPEVARDLAGVSRNINEDVAHWIHEGGRGINEDTAYWIHEGGRGINEDTATAARSGAEYQRSRRPQVQRNCG
ncbi:hypothetical protein HCB18_26615 [Salinispora arenicola]|nr:hypothetical protein [Salinispora arenicola]